MAFLCTGNDLLRGEPVTLAVSVASSDTAVEAVIFTYIADLDQAPDIDRAAVDFFPDGSGAGRQAGGSLFGTMIDQEGVLFFRE